MDINPFDNEVLLLGHVLRYGNDAAKLAIPVLAPDRFVHSKSGEVNAQQDHKHIWQAIVTVYATGVSPSVPAVLAQVKGGVSREDLQSLVTRLTGYYQINGLDPQYVMQLAEAVDKHGLVYRSCQLSSKLSSLIESPEAFARAVQDIEDVDTWLNSHIHRLSSPISGRTEGYRSISEIGLTVLDQMERWQSGEQSLLLPTGLPSADAAALYYAGGMTVHQGRSHAGKSAWVHMVNMGVAIGLKANNVPGCVAVNSLEETDDNLTLKLGGILAGVNTAKLKFGNRLYPTEYERLRAAVEYIRTLPIYVDSTNMLKSSAMRMRLMGLHSSEYGPVRQMSVDYLDLMVSKEQGEDNKAYALEAGARECLRYARETGANVILVTQSTQSDRNQIAGVDGTRGSRGIYHATDVQVETWNPIYMKAANIKFEVPEGLNAAQPFLLVEKHKEMGITPPIPLRWYPEYRRFGDMELPENRLYSHEDVPDFEPEEAEGF